MRYLNRRWPSWFISLIVVWPLLLLWRWLLQGEVLFWGTTLFQFWPWHYLAKTSALAGEWPLWNPWLGNGAPLLANLQTAFFYPPNLLYFFLPVEQGLTLSVLLHLLLAGVLMYAYTRQLGLSPFAAALSGLTYMGSGYLIGRAQFVTMVNAAAWLPLLLLLADRLSLRRATSDGVWLGMTLAVQVLAGHAQLWFYSLWLLAGYIIVRSWQVKPDRFLEPARFEEQPTLQQRGQAVWSALWRFGLAVGLSALLAAAQLLPTAELMLQSPRHSGAEHTFALTYSFWPWRLITLLAPDFFGNPAHGNYWGYANYWEDHAYVGVLPFLLALTAMGRFVARRGAALPRVTLFFVALIPLSLVLALGWNTPVYLWVFNTVPGFGYFQAPARLLIGYTLAMSVLAGVGAETFILTPTIRRGWARLLVVGVGLMAAGLAGRLVLNERSLTFATATFSLGLLLTIAIILLLTRPTQQKKIVWQSIFLVFVAVDLLWFAWPLVPTLPADIFNQPIASANFLKTQSTDERFWVDDRFDYALKFQRYFRFNTFGPLNLDYWHSFKETLTPNLGIYAGLASANNDDPLVVSRWQQLIDLAADSAQRSRLLALMNVGYFITAPDQSAWPVIYRNDTIAIQRVPNTLPRAYFVARAVPVKTDQEALAQLTSPNFDPRREVIIMDTDTTLTFAGLNQAAAVTVMVNQQGANRVTLTVDAPSSGFVVLTDTYYPGWQAVVDGQMAHIWPANLAFRAVAVEAGRHEIVFSYYPLSFTIGLAVSAATLVISLAYIVYVIRLKGQSP